MKITKLNVLFLYYGIVFKMHKFIGNFFFVFNFFFLHLSINEKSVRISHVSKWFGILLHTEIFCNYTREVSTQIFYKKSLAVIRSLTSELG